MEPRISVSVVKTEAFFYSQKKKFYDLKFEKCLTPQQYASEAKHRTKEKRELFRGGTRGLRFNKKGENGNVQEVEGGR